MYRSFLHPRLLVVFVVVLAIVTLAATPVEAQQGSDDPLVTYRAFIDALAKAESLEDLYPFLPASVREELEGMPEETASQVLQRMRDDVDPPPGREEVVEREVSAGRARLVMRAHRTEGDTRVTFEGTVEFLREDGAWKIEDPADWYEMEVLPVDSGSDTVLPPLGPAAREGAGGTFDPAAFRTVAWVSGKGSDWEGSVVFDPRGRYVALGNTRSGIVRLLEVDSLREAWSARVPLSFGTLSFRADGRALAVINHTVPEVLPLMPNLEGRPAGREYYFSRPDLSEAAAAIDGRASWFDLAYHPREPVLALGLGDFADQGAIALWPTGAGLWMADRGEAPEVWRTEGEPSFLAWSPTGDRLAWCSLPGGPEPGSPIHVWAYPGGQQVHRLSRSDFTPSSIVFGPRGERIAVVGGIGDSLGVVAWSIETGEELGAIVGIEKAVFAPDGEHLLVVRYMGSLIEAGVGDEILVWKPGAPAPVHVIPAFPPDEDGRPNFVADLAVSPNGRFLVAVSQEGDVRLWDTAEGR